MHMINLALQACLHLKLTEHEKYDHYKESKGSSIILTFCLLSWQDLYETHFKSSAMGTFLSKIPDTMTTGLDLMHYKPVAGFIDLPGDKRECGIMQDIKISCTSAAARESILARVSKVAQAVESEKKDNEVLTFLVVSSLDSDTEMRLFLRFSSRDAMERHIRRKDLLGMWMASKEDITQMASRGYVPNGKGWLHR